jgi:peptidoglycan hydrolase-like protein with peptidoglycan-binding domain
VQTKLNALAGYPGPLDGSWGPASQVALRNFQQSRGLQVTGEMNQATAATMGLDPGALIANAAPAAPPAPPPSFALSGDSMRIIQARLRQLGFYSGAIDGAWGGGSQSALQSFQASRGLPPDGRVTANTVQALGIDPATMQPPR